MPTGYSFDASWEGERARLAADRVVARPALDPHLRRARRAAGLAVSRRRCRRRIAHGMAVQARGAARIGGRARRRHALRREAQCGQPRGPARRRRTGAAARARIRSRPHPAPAPASARARARAREARPRIEARWAPDRVRIRRRAAGGAPASRALRPLRPGVPLCRRAERLGSHLGAVHSAAPCESSASSISARARSAST